MFLPNARVRLFRWSGIKRRFSKSWSLLDRFASVCASVNCNLIIGKKKIYLITHVHIQYLRRFVILISNFRRVLNVVCLLLSNSPGEFRRRGITQKKAYKICNVRYKFVTETNFYVRRSIMGQLSSKIMLPLFEN